ncbi:pantetheine-phosphate adenylyltransferase [Mycoplasmopsis ciconiae]|uniref:Phosphopantetheine adenylyltransferase n=1 Tax=Mycoplasmopsis ciconiae TaxID=561067 RepID=A0ABU7MLJ7_9BACT|nr:pantetheine-phosphate adenylyltransferase [Mycoplasmopsis ciconiae]
MNKKAIYPGSFDPMHEGHVQVLKKALKLFDHVYVVVSINPDKDTQTNLEKRFEQVKEKTKDIPNITILRNSNRFMADIAKDLKVNFLIRSARNIKDFNYELELAAGNKTLNPDLETVLIIPDYDYIEFSSTLLRHKEKLENV